MEIRRIHHALIRTSAPADVVARFSDLLRRHRLAAGLAQAELATRAGMSLRAVRALEAGHHQAPRARTITRLGGALGLGAEDRAAFESAARAHRLPRTRPLALLAHPPSATPTINAPEMRSHNLPRLPTALVGRERELADLTALLTHLEPRLVTLTGPGGAGKTHLATEVAWALHTDSPKGSPDNFPDAFPDAFPDGVWFVRLAPLRDPALVLPALAAALGLTERGGVAIAEVLRTFLHERTLLVLLDNFEHVAAAAPQVAALLAESDGLKLLVTSRAPLRLRGEHCFPVSPLPVPSTTPGHPVTANQLEAHAATALFIQRARAAQPNFAVNEAGAPAVAALCAQLDGLPLAIELAATWARVLSPAALLARLEHHESVLASGPVDLPARQQTMRATIAWSYDLLGAAEQRLLRRLTVFADGCTLAAAEAVCQAPAGAAPLGLDLVEGLGRLLDQSLIVPREVEGEIRFGMLHVVGEFARERLEASGEAEVLRRAHARYVLAFAEAAEPALRGPDDITWMHRVERELGNVRAALEWARAAGEAEAGLRLATALWRFWTEAGYLSEGRQWIETFLALAPAEAETVAEAADASNPPGASIPTWLRARALSISGGVAAAMGEIGPALAALEAGIRLGRAADDWVAQVIGLLLVGMIVDLMGEPRRAEACYAEALALGRAHEDALTIFTALGGLAGLACAEQRWAEATARFTEALQLVHATDRLHYAAAFLVQLGEVALWQGEAPHAAVLLREALVVARETNWAIGWRRWDLTEALDLLAVACAQQSQPEHGARLLGAAAQLRDTFRLPYVSAELPRREPLVAPIRAALTAEPWAAAFAAGRAMTLEEAIAQALAAPDSPEDAPPRNGPAGLTTREREVLRLLAEGLSFAQIAERLVISARTVNNHTTAIYGKLGVTSRATAARYAQEHGLL